ncbi:MAG: hypothetical protein IKN30_07600 [Synergistaceae bacterium]|nr:hypothetical protein [Synergistaceae bacterium]
MNVNFEKLKNGLQRSFEGVAMVFESLGAEILEPAKKELELTQEKNSITLDDVTKAIVKLIKKDTANNQKIGEIVKKYGVEKVHEIPPEKFVNFMEDLAALK